MCVCDAHLMLLHLDAMILQYSYYQKSRCTKLSYVMHELGHSVLGFEHSSSRDDEFGDISCYMGFSRNVTAYPRKSFVRFPLQELCMPSHDKTHVYCTISILECPQALAFWVV